MTNEELLSILELANKIRTPTGRWSKVVQPDPIWNMMIYLVRRYFVGRLVTPSSLARAANVPYATAVRRIQEMQAEGLIGRRPSVGGQGTFSIYPTEELLNRVLAYAEEAKASIARSLGHDPKYGQPFYLGASHLSASIIPAPSAPKIRAKFDRPLELALYDDLAFTFPQVLGDKISKLLGGKVNFRMFPPDELRTQILSNARSSNSAFDIVAFNDLGALVALDELIEEAKINRADFHPAEWEGALTPEHQYGLPLQTNQEILFCRQDFFDQAGFELPSTTEQLLAAARAMHNPQKDVYGVAWTGRAKTPVGQAFLQFLADFDQPLLNLRAVPGGYDATHLKGDEFRPLVESRKSRMTAEFMMQLIECSHPNVLDMSWPEPATLFGAGKVAMAYEWANRASRFEFSKASPARANACYLPHPVGVSGGRRLRHNNVSPIGGFALGIPANTDPKRRSLAWHVLQWLASPEVIKLLFMRTGIVPSRFSVAADPGVRRGSRVIAAVDEMARLGQLRLWPRPPVKEYSKIVEILGEDIHAMLRKDQSVKAALSNAQARIDALMRANGRY